MRMCRHVALVVISACALAATAAGAPQKRPPATAPHVTIEMLDRFADAWNRHDVDALMSFMTPDAVFEGSAGNEVDGTRSEGTAAVRAAYAGVFKAFPDAHWGNLRHFIAGDRGLSEWTFTGTQTDGKRVEVTGCDVFTFRGDKIAVKNSFRKNRPPF